MIEALVYLHRLLELRRQAERACAVLTVEEVRISDDCGGEQGFAVFTGNDEEDLAEDAEAVLVYDSKNRGDCRLLPKFELQVIRAALTVMAEPFDEINGELGFFSVIIKGPLSQSVCQVGVYELYPFSGDNFARLDLLVLLRDVIHGLSHV